MEISDFFHNPLGRGERTQPSHLFEWNFHLDPAVIVVERSFSLIELKNKDVEIIIEFPEELVPSVYESEYSPRYGVKVPCRALYARFKGDASDKSFVFRISVKNNR